MTAAASPPATLTALGRSVMYGLLARALAYPEPPYRREIRDLAGEMDTLPPAFRTAAQVLLTAMPDHDELEFAHARLFTHSTSHDCPAFETAYTSKEIFRQVQEMADIAGFYRAFGVEAAPGAERADHITAELEFMQFLAAKEAHAATNLGVSRERQCRRAQRLFLQDHLGGWAQAFARRVELSDPSGWYGATGALLRAWLDHECRTLRVRPEIPAGEPVMAWPEPESEACGIDSEQDGCAGCPPGEAPPPGALPLPLLQG